MVCPMLLVSYASCDILLLPHMEAGRVLEEATSDAGKRQQEILHLRALPLICGETRAKLLISAESVVLRSLAASTLVWSTRARHTPSL